MAPKALPSPEVLRQLLRYEPDTGKLFWRERPLSFFSGTAFRGAEHCCANWNAIFAGKEAFTAFDRHGYAVGRIFDRLYRAHRVAWCLHYGAWPVADIDHINQIKPDNRIANLRDVTNAENCLNRGLQSNNSSGFAGVYWHKSRSQWAAEIKIGGKRTKLGYFNDLSEAVAARKSAEQRLGFHPNHGSAPSQT